MDNVEVTYSVMLDISDVFDTVNHNIFWNVYTLTLENKGWFCHG